MRDLFLLRRSLRTIETFSVLAGSEAKLHLSPSRSGGEYRTRRWSRSRDFRLFRLSVNDIDSAAFFSISIASDSVDISSGLI